MPKRLFILLALLGGGCERTAHVVAPPPAPARAGGARPVKVRPFTIPDPDVVLLITGGTHGRLEVCNCPGPMPGGLTRRSGLVTSYRHAFRNVFLLDSGDLFWIEQDDPRNAYVLKGYRTIGYDAVVLGDHEWAALPGPLPDQLAAAPLKYLATNVIPKVRLPVVQAVVRDFGNARLAVISYLGAGTLSFLPGLVPGRMTLTGVEAVSAEAARLKGQRCLVVLVAHARQEEIDRLRGVANVDLIVCGHTTRSEGGVTRLGGVPLVKVGGADYVGAVAMRVRDGRIAEIDCRLEVLTTDWPEDKRLMDIYQAYAHEAMRRALAGEKKVTLDYVPSASCGRCHEKQHAGWRRGPHRGAYQTLVKARRTGDPDCLMCHTSGFGTAKGFRTFRDTPALAGVNCQDCHRFNLDEHTDKDRRHRPPKVGEDTCTICHTPITSPRFTLGKSRPRVGCVR